MERKFYIYWIIALLYSILFREIIGPIIAGDNLPFFQDSLTFSAFLIYHILVSYIFALFLTRTRLLYALIAMFIYGFVIEMVFFGHVNGPGDIFGILFFGSFYVFLFGVPWYITTLLVRHVRDKHINPQISKSKVHTRRK